MATYLQGFLRKHLEKILTALVPQALTAIGEKVAGRLHVQWFFLQLFSIPVPMSSCLFGFSLEPGDQRLLCQYAKWKLGCDYTEWRETNGAHPEPWVTGWQVGLWKPLTPSAVHLAKVALRASLNHLLPLSGL